MGFDNIMRSFLYLTNGIDVVYNNLCLVYRMGFNDFMKPFLYLTNGILYFNEVVLSFIEWDFYIALNDFYI